MGTGLAAGGGGGEDTDKNKDGREAKGDEVVAGPNQSNPGRHALLCTPTRRACARVHAHIHAHTHNTLLHRVRNSQRKRWRIRNRTVMFGECVTTASLLFGSDGFVSLRITFPAREAIVITHKL